MSTVTALNTLRDFLAQTVSPTIKLQKADDKNVHNYSLVEPSVHVGWLPPKGYLPEDQESGAPCLIVGMDGGTHDTTDSDINIRITVAVFNPGEHKQDDSAIAYTPNFLGYIDLLNLMDRTVAEVTKARIIGSKLSVQDPIKWGMYEEQPYPYWYGWITFSVRQAPYPRAGAEKMLI